MCEGAGATCIKQPYHPIIEILLCVQVGYALVVRFAKLGGLLSKQYA